MGQGEPGGRAVGVAPARGGRALDCRGRAIVLTLAIAIAPAAHAQGNPNTTTDGAPSVDVADLPPLPPATETPAGSATVYAATSAEEDIVVGAAKREQSLGSVASAVTVISADRIRRFGYRTVAEALSGAAGVHVTDDDLTTRVGIRGLQILGDFNTRLLVLIDGATLNETWGSYAGVDWDFPVPIDDVLRIEVIRGPVSSVYGTNAFFGIINIVTRGAAEAPRAWGRVTGSTMRAGVLSAGFSAGGVDRQIRGSAQGLLRGGEVLNAPGIGSDLDADGMRATALGLVGVYHGAFAQVRFYHHARELTFAPYDSVPDDDRTRAYDTLGVAEGGYTRELGKLTLSGRGYFNAYRYSDYLIPASDPTVAFLDYGDTLWFGGELRGRYAIIGQKLGVTAGGEATFIQTESRSYYETDLPANRIVVPTDLQTQGIYAEADAQPVSWFALTGGVRFDRNSLLEDRLSPRAAIFVANKDRFGAKLLYAEGFRNPSAYEAFFEDGTDFEANPDLRAETIRSYEAVVWARPGAGVSVRLSGFHWDANRLIDQEELPSGLIQFQNVGRAKTTGVEAEISYRDTRGWYGFAGGAVAKVRDADDERIPGSPAVTTTTGVSSPLLFGLGHISTEVNVVSRRPTRDPALRTRTHVGWGATIYVPDLRGFDVTIGARNLIGRHEEVPAPEDYDRMLPDTQLISSVPGKGREVYARVGYRFE